MFFFEKEMVLLFYIFAGLTIFSCLRVITAKNSVHAVLALILAFFNVAALFLLQGAEYLAMTLVIVYVGAVAVLFLFVVMMLNVEVETTKRAFVRYLPSGILLLAVVIGLLTFAYFDPTEMSRSPRFQPDTITEYAKHHGHPSISNVEAIGRLLYTDYFLAFQICGLILFAAMVGAIVLTVRHSKNVKRQSIFEQNMRSRSESVELVEVRSRSGVKL